MTSSVFEQTYDWYLEQIKKKDILSVVPRLGGTIVGTEVTIDVFGSPYTISEHGISDHGKKQAPFPLCVILSRYIIMCPDYCPQEKDWVSYRDVRDSSPLVKYFTNEVETAIAGYFSGKTVACKERCCALGGRPPSDITARYDVLMQFTALPLIPLVVLFNDRDDEFPARCSVLFERRAECYLDAECLALLGRHLFELLTL